MKNTSKMRKRYKRWVQYDEIFDDTPKTIKEYFQELPKTEVIMCLAHICSYHRNNSKYNKNWSAFLGNFFSKPNQELYYLTEKKINGILSHDQNLEITITSQIGLLGLLDEALLLDENNIEHDSIKLEQNIFKAILLKNTENGKKQENIKNNLSGKNNFLELLLSNSIVDFDLNNRLEYEIIISQIIKSYYFFEFTENNPELKLLQTEVFKEIGVESKNDIFKILFDLAFKIANRNEGLFHFTIDINELQLDMFKIVLYFSKIKLSEEFDFKNIRSNPIYRELKKNGEKEEFYILHPFMFYDKIFKGWYFIFNEVNDKLNSNKKISNLKSTLGQLFSEDYLLASISKNLFHEKSIHFSGSELKLKFPTIDSEPDYYVRDWDKIYLFENKDTLLKAETKTSYNYSLIEKELIEKLYKTPSNKPKAVLQLVGNILKILENKLLFDNIEFPEKIKIFPILILHDECFNAIGMNYLLNQWFQKELKLIEQKGLPIKNVNPLVIISIDTYILIQNALKIGKINLHLLLKEYAILYLKKPNINLQSFAQFAFSKLNTIGYNPKHIEKTIMIMAFGENWKNEIV